MWTRGCIKAESRSFSVLELVTCRDLCSLELEFVDGFKEVLLQCIITSGIAIDPSIDSYDFLSGIISHWT